MGVNGIYGLSGSGLDIESMVKVGMMSRQNEYDKMAQKYTKNEWTKTEFINLNNQITTFNMTTLSQYKMSSSMNSKLAESSSDAIKVSANATAGVMNHKVNVENLSSNAYLLGTNSMTRYDVTGSLNYKQSVKLADVLFSSLTKSTVGDETYVSGNIAAVTAASKNNDWIKAIQVENTNNTIDLNEYEKSEQQYTYKGELVVDENNNAVYAFTKTTTDADGNQATETKYAVNAGDADNPSWQEVNISNIYTDGKSLEEEVAFGDNNSVKLSDVAFKFKISDGATEDDKGNVKQVEISYTYADLLGSDNSGGISFNDLASKINGSGLNIRAAYDSVNDKFSFYNSHGGSENTINFIFDDDSDASLTARNFFNNMGLLQSRSGELVDAGNQTEKNGEYVYDNTLLFKLNGDTTFTGEDGSITVDGMKYKTTDNRVTVGGITYSALNKTENAATVTVTQNVDSIVDKVKGFVEDYNKILASLYEKYDEKPETGYKPLTQSQKDQMKEEQVTKWEEKAKKGLLYHDATIAKIIGDMRSAISSTVEGVEGKYNSAYSIGISTTGIKGQLTLDETKLRNALAEDSDSVYNVFAKLDANDETSKNGVAQRLGDVFTTATKAIKDRAGSSNDITEDSDLNNLLRELQTKMSNFKKMMSSFEDALYKKYDAMESALAKLGMQMNFVTGSFQ